MHTYSFGGGCLPPSALVGFAIDDLVLVRDQRAFDGMMQGGVLAEAMVEGAGSLVQVLLTLESLCSATSLQQAHKRISNHF